MTTEVAQVEGYVAGQWNIDTAHSDVGFVIRHVMVSKVRGHFTKFEGQIVLAADPLESTVTVTVDMTSIDTASEQRDEHLRNVDFFEVEKYPVMTYTSTGIRQDGMDYVLDGDLTLKGVTRPVPLKFEINGFIPDPLAADPFAGGRAGFSATGEIDRTDFGVNYNGPIPGGGMALGDKVKIELEIEASLNPAA